MTGTNHTILVTGGAGFIGSNFVLKWMETEGSPIVNLDLLTYAGNLPANLAAVDGDSRYRLVCGEICNAELIATTARAPTPGHRAFHAAESPTWTAPLLGRKHSSAPTCMAYSPCWSKRGSICRGLMKPTGVPSVSFTFRPTKSTDLLGPGRTCIF